MAMYFLSGLLSQATAATYEKQAASATRRTGLLHPQESETREVKSLDGLWRFKADAPATGFREQWHSHGLPAPTMPMAVPASYNELAQGAQSLREHVGLVWCVRDLPQS